MTEAERREHLAEAGYNPLLLPAARVPFDLFSDVPRESLVPAADRRVTEAAPDQVREALSPITGDAKLALGTRGRAAEIALVEALALGEHPVVLTHGLFTTTSTALGRRGAVIEQLRLARPEGTTDVDLDHLDERLGKGGVRLVYLELASNALFGWPLTFANVAAVRARCDRHGALLVIDAARPLSNSAAQDADDLAAAARRKLALAHAFTISCASEFLVPVGSVIGSPDAALIARTSQLLFEYGTSMCAMDWPQPRADLLDGVRYSLAHPDLVRDRLALVRRLAAALADRAVEVAQPVTAHAVYVPIDGTLLPIGDTPAMLSVLAHLYVVGGARAQITGTKRGPALRLALPLCTSLDDARLRELAIGVASAIARFRERPALRFADGQTEQPYFRRLAPVERA
jgi:tryptophanase